MDVPLSRQQHAFVVSDAQFPCFCGGYGSGKSHALIVRAIVKKIRYPEQSVAYYLPTFDLCRVIGFPRFSEQLTAFGFKFELNKTFATIDIEGMGRIIFRTLDSPERIVGFEVADSFVDELDTLPLVKARDVWHRIIARNRQKKADGSLNTVAVGSTPEGFAFIYETWQRDPKPGYQLIKAPTSSNLRNLPDGYIESLQSVYPSNLLAAYLDGEFVNLTAGSVYPEFSRLENASTEVIRQGDGLHIGLDFNVTKMAAVIHVLRGDEPHAVEELTGIFDTPAMIRVIQERYVGHAVMVYPDASGASRKSTNASLSDIALLQQAGFTVRANAANPAVKDRILAANLLIHNGITRSRRYRVNIERCPMLSGALEQQAYDANGEPEKRGLDHIVDAATYFIAYRYPIVKRQTIVTPLRM